MSRTARRVGSAVALASALTAPVAVASGAQATSATTQAVVVVRDDGLYRTAPDFTSPVQLTAPGPSSLSNLNASGDGSRFAYELRDFSSTKSSATMTSRIVVRDASGQLVRTLDARTAKQNSDFSVTGAVDFGPALSSDGNTAVWAVFDFGTGAVMLRRAAVGAGAPVTIDGSSGMSSPQFLNTTTLLVQDNRNGALKTFPLRGGSASGLTGAPSVPNSFSVSPGGTRLAYSDSPATASTDRLSVAGLTNTAGAWSLGAPTVLTDTFVPDEPARFSQDAATLLWPQTLNNGEEDVFSVPVTGGTPADLSNTADDFESSVVGIALDDGTAPAPATATPFTLAGTSAVLHWTLPAVRDLSGVQVTRKLAGVTQQTVFVAAPLTSYTDTGLVLGKTYSYEFASKDRSGHLAVAAVRNLTATKAGATFADPTSTLSHSAKYRVTFSPAANHTVEYRTNGAGVFKRWFTLQPGASRVFGQASTGAAATTSTPGDSYAFRVIAYDAYGNSSVPTSAGTAVVPFDQTRATFSSGTVTSPGSDRYLGSVRTLKLAGSAARLTIAGNRFQIVGERCTRCGVMDVYVDGTRVAGIDTRASTRQARRVLFARGLTAGRNHTIVVKARGTAGRPNVVLDGFAVRR